MEEEYNHLSKKGIDTDSREHHQVINSIFTSEDRDGNGYISHEEFSGPKHEEL